MRIAEVAPPWLSIPPSGYGGIEWVVALLADGLADRGHDVTLFATGDSRTRARLDAAFAEAAGPAAINDPILDTIQALHAFRTPDAFDVYHVHSPFAPLAVGAHVDTPVVHTVHGSLTDEVCRLYSFVRDRIRFVAISHSQAATMTGLGPVDVVHNGVDVEAWPFREEKEDFLLFLGRAAPEKGVLRAVMAARRADLPLVLVVKVAHREEVRHWNEDVRPLIPSDAVVVYDVDHDQKVDLLGRARALLFPIDWEEPFGLVMAEAMACGTPVLATPRGAAPEVVADGETGLLLPVEGYEEAVAEALPRLDEISPLACRRRVEEMFSQRSMVEGYEAVFRDAVG
jgi:glycosyltransferase involved in cell wall biosynthesis